MDREVTVLSSFLAGVASFINPCVIALLPFYVSAVFGQRRSLTRAIAFGLGFLIWFVLLGSAAVGVSCTFTQSKYSDVQNILIIAIGILFIFYPVLEPLFAKGEAGIQRLLAPLQKSVQKLIPAAKSGSVVPLLTAFLLGIVASLAWTPCVGPVLGAILTMSVTERAGIVPGVMLAVYGLGLLVPFLLLAFFWDRVKIRLSRMRHFFLFMYPVVGIILVGYGLFALAGF